MKLNINAETILFILLGSCLLKPTVASPGDNLDEFIDCTYACEYQRQCPGSMIHYIDPETNMFHKVQFTDTPWLYSHWLLWDCISDCDYQCQQVVTRLRIHDNEEVYQFHGKWPFLRLFGTQELFSVIFSVGNFIPHYQGYHKLLNTLKQSSVKQQAYGNVLINYTYVAIAGMSAWTASSIFHFRDTLVTEKLDYFFAGLTVMSAFHALFSRMTRLYLYKTLSQIFTMCMCFIFALHLLRLYIDWSYTYNMRFNVFFGVLQYMLLLLLSYQNYMTITRNKKSDISLYNDKHKRQQIIELCITPVLLVIFTGMAMSLELFDFFQYNCQIDAHALWHACTIIPSFYLYKFLLADWQQLAEQKHSH